MTAPALDLARLRVLVVDDEEDLRQGLARLVASQGAVATTAADGVEALEVLEEHGADVVLTDLMMPRMSGAELLVEIKRRSPDVEVVILTGFGTVESAVRCMQDGAAHFLTKPFDNDEVVRLVRRFGRFVLARRAGPEDELDLGDRRIVAEDPRSRAVLDYVARIAGSPVPVLVEGESGTGKELIARAVHEQSGAATKPFLALNAAALPDTLLESELFGHEKGAFTGADQRHEGLFARAEGGTVFLDEVSSMSPAFQGKLLRVLQERVVRRLGASEDEEVDFRLVSATNRDLGAMIRAGQFREDLFYRLGVVRVYLPPLRERPGDIPALARHFLTKAAAVSLGADATVPRLSGAALDELSRHTWPGNVRELENAIQRAMIVCTGDSLEPWHLGLHAPTWGSSPPGDGPELDYATEKNRAVEDFQRVFVHRALEQAGGNVSRAASACGLTRAALQRIMRQHRIERSAYQA